MKWYRPHKDIFSFWIWFCYLKVGTRSLMLWNAGFLWKGLRMVDVFSDSHARRAVKCCAVVVLRYCRRIRLCFGRIFCVWRTCVSCSWYVGVPGSASQVYEVIMIIHLLLICGFLLFNKWLYPTTCKLFNILHTTCQSKVPWWNQIFNQEIVQYILPERTKFQDPSQANQCPHSKFSKSYP